MKPGEDTTMVQMMIKEIVSEVCKFTTHFVYAMFTNSQHLEFSTCCLGVFAAPDSA